MKPRLLKSREMLTQNPRLVDLLTHYKTWVNYTEWLVFKGIDLDTGEVHYKAALASKRGNKVYNWRVRKRLKDLDKIKDKPHTLGYFSRGIAKPLTAALFITLTYSGVRSLGDTWADIGPEFDKWRARIRSRYGKFEFIRCWEAHQGQKKNNYVHRGYPHIHILLVFQDAEFKVFRHNLKYRIVEKPDFEWEWGWVDVQACRDLKDGISYIAKYIGKAHNIGSRAGDASPPEELTLALTWFYGKRGWSLSRAFNDLIRTLHNPNPVDPFAVVDSPIKWYLMGFWGAAPLQLILDDAELGFTRKLLAPQYWSVYGKPGWTDFDKRSTQVYDVDDRWGLHILKASKRLRGGDNYER